tara:strand:- start:1211 stop:3535 length:2325 start_codon:yes stop_codon:yes gene_type:complete
MMHSPASAQTEAAAPAEAESNDDIVVTARQRGESLVSVPVAVSALNAAGIERYSATDLNRIADNIPAVQITRSSNGSGAVIAIRGIYSSQLDPGLESAVSVSIDGIQLSRGYITQAAFFDLQQVEVLKGPQALFFGKNSPAGVISLKSAGPSASWQGYAKAGYEFRANERFLEAAVGGPVTDNLGVRVAVRGSDMDGWLRNTAGPLANPIEPGLSLPGYSNNKITPAARSLAGRATLEWRPTDNFSATARLLYSDYHDNDPNGQQQVVSCGGRAHPSTLGFQDPYADCKPDNRRSFGAPNAAILAVFPGLAHGSDYYTDNKSILGSLTLGYKMDNLTLNSISGIYDLRLDSFGNYDPTVYSIFPGHLVENSRIYTQEWRATSSYDGPVNFMLGAYYEHGKRFTSAMNRGGAGFPVPFDPAFGGASVAFDGAATVRSDTYSAFGQLMWDITDAVQLSGGVRYTKEHKSARRGNRYVSPIAVAIYAPVGKLLTGDFDDSNWSPEASLSWHPTPGQTLYAAYKSGYKSGGFSTTGVTSITAKIEDLTFGSETARGGEIGYKARLLDRRMTFTSAIFNYKFNGLQRSALDIPTTTFQVRNAASARTKGVEAEVAFQLNDALELRASGSYNKAYYLNFTTAPCFNGQTAAQGCVNRIQDLTGRAIALAPRYNATAGFTYDIPISSAIGLGVTGDVRYVSGYATQDDRTPGAHQDGYAKFNASARIHESDNRWEISLIGLNLFNKYAVLFTTSKPGGSSGDLYGPVERGREVRLQSTYRF